MPAQKCMLLLLLIGILVLSSTVAAASAEDWLMFRHDLNRSGDAEGTVGNAAGLRWAANMSASVLSSPAVSEGCVVVGCRDNVTYCFNASSSRMIWSFRMGWEVDSSPAIAYGCVFVGCEDGWLYCLNFSSGYPVWISKVGGYVHSSPAVADGRVYVGSMDYDFFCYNAADGALLWSFPTRARINASPAIDNGTVYVASHDGFVYALNCSSGEEIWRNKASAGDSSPCISGGCLYIGGFNGYLYCLNASTGEENWRTLTGDTVGSSPAAADGRVYVGSDDCNVYCFNASSGEIIWRFKTGFWVWSSPAVADGRVYVGSQDYRIWCLDAASGEEVWSYQTGGIVESSPAVADNMLYVGSHDRNLYAFSLNETAYSLPQTAQNLPWGTIVFDALACLVAAIIAVTGARYIQAFRQNQRTQTPKTQRSLKRLLTNQQLLCGLLILAFIILFYQNLNLGPLWSADEKTYSQIAYSMVKRGDYLVPYTYGESGLWTGKPPLLMWMMALGYQMFGFSIFAARFWLPLFGGLSLAAVFFLGKKLYGANAGLLSVLVLGTMATFWAFSSHAMTDVPLLFFMLSSLYFMIEAQQKQQSSSRYAVLGGLFFGLAFLTKQVEALLIPILVIAYFVIKGKSVRAILTKELAVFSASALAVFGPYLAYMGFSFREFWSYYFGYCVYTRSVTPIEGHVGDWLFYFNYLSSKETQLWMLLLVPAAALCVYKALRRSKSDLLIIVWIVVVLGIFTLAQTKLYWYILPAMPAFALALGSLLAQTGNAVWTLLKKTVGWYRGRRLPMR
ncbi:MAG: PQQ-binding-like beta-propeller repeat protein [Candidatus Bathyarchaeota archaeon]|nr:PQQ-binding-like beta-propeller repeat protein [Candidatus Bathyarchaeota archaeon]